MDPHAPQPAFAAPMLYDPDHVQDACGTGFIAQMSGQPSHRVLEKAIEAVVRLTHRGGVNADAATGDGAGLLTQIPRRFFQRELAARDVRLGENERFGVGMMFLPRSDAEAREKFLEITESVLREHGFPLLAWRNAPTNWSVLGSMARSTLPWFEQVIFAPPPGSREERDLDAFTRTCYLVRRTIQRRAREAGITDFSICSFSGDTIVYKGLFVAPQMSAFWADLRDPDFETAIALFHQRYSTNTLPNWHMVQPFRRLAHNGEINTLRGNLTWMKAREPDLHVEEWAGRMDDILPIVENAKGSDSASLDNVFEFLSLTGRDILHAMMMMVPEAHEHRPGVSSEARAFYQHHAALMEPWDGPAALSFTDGRIVGASLDRNGLRPARYKVSDDGLVVLGSEVGLIDMEDAHVVEKGRLGPGRMLAIDTSSGRLFHDEEIKQRFTSLNPYADWVKRRLIPGAKLAVEHPEPMQHFRGKALLQRQIAHGWTAEDVTQLLVPMVERAIEPTGSMGDDTPLPFLSKKPRFLYEYFRQRFAQVTNPAIDPIRERAVMSLETLVGPRRNLASDSEEHCAVVRFPSPILGRDELAWLRRSDDHPLRVATIHAWFEVAGGTRALDEGLERLCRQAEEAIRDGATCLIISNVEFNEWRAPISTLLAVGAVHQHLLRRGMRMRASLIAETGGAKAVHNLACIIGHGANAVCPTMAFDQIEELCEEGAFDTSDFLEATERYFQAINKGLLKIMSKMGISTISSYCGAQTFEAVGVSKELIDRCFTGTPSSIGGIGLEEIAEQAVNLHREAYPEPVVGALADLGLYRYNRKGEHHGFNPTMRKVLHQAVRSGEWKDYRAYAAEVHGGPQAALRDLLEPIARPEPGAIEEVEPAEAIMRRFNTAAMSLGALSPEAHETLAVAMNRIGGRSNSGEGGEDPLRHGTERNSAIKQVASGRFGVTPAYLLSGDQLEIKIAQGAKPGEGGQLPGFKVSEYIARLRHAQVGTTLISPPPHHDIYSIEDLAQLIFDLKHVHPAAKVSVKLVAESGVGTIAAGCAKAGADIIHIAGHEGGTGASPLSSIKHAGSPWEMGLAETQQALVVNQLRERVTLRADGGLKTGRDVIIAALLGADEFGFGTIAVIAEGCVMARQCHMNNCPVGVATQRDDLRKKFPGTADHVVRFFQFVAEEIREHLAALGATSLNDVIGHPELLRVRMPADEPRAAKISLAAMLAVPAGDHPRHCTRARNDRKAETVDAEMIERSMPALERGEPVEFEMRVRNTHLTIGGRLASEVTKRHGEHTLAPGTITARLHGTAGQSFGAFCVEGIRLLLTGEANDYVGKGLTGGELVIRAAEDAAFDASRSVLAGNTILYGATCGSLFIGGRVGERFAVRNSGAESVVEGVGDHGCEYMTGGHVAILGPIGRNFAAGFTGGLVHILCEQDDLEAHINRALVTVGALEDPEEIGTLRNLIERHRSFTGSAKAARLLEDWDGAVKQFVRIVPKDAEREVEPRPRLKPEKRSKTSTRA